MRRGVTFDEDSARRIASVVRQVERDGGRTSRPPRKSRIYHPVSAGTVRMIIAKADMIANDTLYSCRYLDSDGTESDETIQVKRPNGIYIDTGYVGFLGQDTGGENIFIPANLREEEHLALTIETRTNDPTSPETGRIWMRTDL